MLTCQIGEKVINTFDFSPLQLKEWSNKGILKCPVCGSEMLYKHGEIKIPHFAHVKDSDCEEIYSEPETEEHLQGKKVLYDFLSTQPNICNLKLEAWIPETKQRPDLYFEIEDSRYVVEFQCSPIATEYIHRKKLYELAGIKDIWILGTKKYNILIDNTKATHAKRLKEIERHNHMYLDVDSQLIALTKGHLQNILQTECFDVDKYLKYSLQDIFIDSNVGDINISKEFQDMIRIEDDDKREKYLKRQEEEQIRREQEQKKREEDERLFEFRKNIFDALPDYCASLYDYSEVARNLKFVSRQSWHSRDTNGFPCLKYWYSNYRRGHCLYLNNFNKAKDKDYISLNECNNLLDFNKYFEDRLDFSKMFSIDEILLLDDMSVKIENDMTTDSIKLEFEVADNSSYLIYLKYYTLHRVLAITIEKEKLYEIEDKYKYICNLINEKTEELNTVENRNQLLDNFISILNYKYRTEVKRQWEFKKYRKYYKLLNYGEIIYKNVAQELINSYIEGNIEYNIFTKNLSNEISKNIRNYIYK